MTYNTPESNNSTGPRVYDLDTSSQTKITPNATTQKAQPEMPNNNQSSQIQENLMPKKHSPTKKTKRFRLTKRKKIVLTIISTIILTVLIPGLYVGIQAKNMQSTVTSTEVHARAAMDALKSQNLMTAKTELQATQESLTTLNNQYQSLAFLKYTPLKSYVDDGQKAINSGKSGIEAAATVVNSIEPYADILGLKGEGTFAGGSIEDRIVKILETLQEVSPALDEAAVKLQIASTTLDEIDPSRYPIKIKDKDASEVISKIQAQLDEASMQLNTFIPVIKQLPQIAGIDGEKKYLILFQNDGELRPTGGFMTAYAVMNINKGKVTPEKSDDIYELDNKFTQKLKPPEPIEKYLPLVKTWNLRDMNLSPDFRTSMETFIPYYNQLPGEAQVEGVIAIDTQLLANLMEVLGPIEVPGYGTYTTDINPRCNCPDVIYQLEDITTRPTPYFRSDRKAILGPMMAAILQKAYDAPQEVWPQLFQTGLRSINEKHVLFYFFNEEAQAAAEASNFAGTITQNYQGDYLHINDSNFGGAKSNIFVNQEVEQEVKRSGDKLQKTLTVVYKNPQKGDNCNLEAGQLCLNGILRSWVRFYVPKDSVLIESLGFQEGSVKTSEDLSYTVIEGFYTVSPLSQTKLVLNYEVPYKEGDEYNLLIQKQPGTRAPHYVITTASDRQEFDLIKDTKVNMAL